MNSLEQLPMFSFDHGQVVRVQQNDGRVWLGFMIDHRQLFEALQDEWLRPPESAPGRILAVGAFANSRREVRPENRIITRIQVDPTRLPTLDVAILRAGQWIVGSIADVRTDDEAVCWPGVLPTSAMARILVSTNDEQLRLASLARQFSNILLPSILGIVSDEPERIEPNDFPSLMPAGIVLPSEVDAIRGATAMAMWAVPHVDPWLDILVASLTLPPRKNLPELVRLVSAPWWAWPLWTLTPASDWPNDLQCRLWLAASIVFRSLNHDNGIGADEIVQKIVARALNGKDEHVDTAALNAWSNETLSILRGDARVTIDDWKSSPVGKALQLVLVRPEPGHFRTWLDQLSDVSPALWWSAAALCGLLHGYLRLDVQFRGGEAQRRMLSIHALHACDTAMAGVVWLGNSASEPEWTREGGEFVLYWNGAALWKRQQFARARWLAADLNDKFVRSAAEELARHSGWPCFRWECNVSDVALTIDGASNVDVDPGPPHRICVRGPARMSFPPGTRFKQVFDAEEFRYRITTEGGDIPGPPTPTSNIVRFRQDNRPPDRSPAQTTLIADAPVAVIQQEIPGLVYLDDFLTETEEAELINHIDRSEWILELTRRVQHYGWRYNYKEARIDASMRLGPLPLWAAKLAERLSREALVPHLADQVIVNEYVGNQGISKHIDCRPCFADGIAMLSLLESWEMVFTGPHGDKPKVTRLLKQRSIAVMTGDARHLWTHEIPKRKKEPSGLLRRRRISVTFRKVNEASLAERGRP